MSLRLRLWFLIFLQCGAFAVLAADSGLDIQDPPGMKAVVTRDHGVTHIRFVPKAATLGSGGTAAAPPAAAGGDAATTPAPTKPSKPADRLDKLNLDLPISAIPAFTALDVSPETVAHPSSPRDFAAALLNGVDRHGVLQNGVALETAPFRLFGLIRSDIRAYNDSSWSGYFDRMLYNFSFSLATSKASDKSDAVQLALGFSTILYQDKESDPRRNSELAATFHQVNLDHPMHGIPIGVPTDQVADEDPVAKKTLQDAVEAFRQKSWVGTTWAAAAAPTWNSESGKASELKSNGYSAWTTVAYGLQDPIIGDTIRLQFLGHIRYRQGEHVVDTADKTKTASQDTLIAAGRLRLGTTDFNAFVEGGYVRIWDGLEGSGSGWRTAGGVEKKLNENLWLVLSAGEQFGGAATKGDELFAVGSFRLGSADKPQFAPGN
jgi:hypothetical protein